MAIVVPSTSCAMGSGSALISVFGHWMSTEADSEVKAVEGGIAAVSGSESVACEVTPKSKDFVN